PAASCRREDKHTFDARGSAQVGQQAAQEPLRTTGAHVLPFQVCNYSTTGEQYSSGIHDLQSCNPKMRYLHRGRRFGTTAGQHLRGGLPRTSPSSESSVEEEGEEEDAGENESKSSLRGSVNTAHSVDDEEDRDDGMDYDVEQAVAISHTEQVHNSCSNPTVKISQELGGASESSSSAEDLPKLQPRSILKKTSACYNGPPVVMGMGDNSPVPEANATPTPVVPGIQQVLQKKMQQVAQQEQQPTLPDGKHTTGTPLHSTRTINAKTFCRKLPGIQSRTAKVEEELRSLQEDRDEGHNSLSAKMQQLQLGRDETAKSAEDVEPPTMRSCQDNFSAPHSKTSWFFHIHEQTRTAYFVFGSDKTPSKGEELQEGPVLGGGAEAEMRNGLKAITRFKPEFYAQAQRAIQQLSLELLGGKLFRARFDKLLLTGYGTGGAVALVVKRLLATSSGSGTNHLMNTLFADKEVSCIAFSAPPVLLVAWQGSDEKESSVSRAAAFADKLEAEHWTNTKLFLYNEDVLRTTKTASTSQGQRQQCGLRKEKATHPPIEQIFWLRESESTFFPATPNGTTIKEQKNTMKIRTVFPLSAAAINQFFSTSCHEDEAPALGEQQQLQPEINGTIREAAGGIGNPPRGRFAALEGEPCPRIFLGSSAVKMLQQDLFVQKQEQRSADGSRGSSGHRTAQEQNKQRDHFAKVLKPLVEELMRTTSSVAVGGTRASSRGGQVVAHHQGTPRSKNSSISPPTSTSNSGRALLQSVFSIGGGAPGAVVPMDQNARLVPEGSAG
ncbi:unnamed protein product, partial [Amoebophrya sp. A120]